MSNRRPIIPPNPVCEDHWVTLADDGTCYMCEGQAKRDRRFYSIIMAMIVVAIVCGLLMGR